MIWSRRSDQRSERALTSHAEVVTATPERYARQLASHLGHRVTIDTTPDGDVFRFGEGEGLVRAGDGILELRATGNDARGLAVVQDVLGRHLARFGERAGLTVTWSDPAPANP
jgi:hypothetical protein